AGPEVLGCEQAVALGSLERSAPPQRFGLHEAQMPTRRAFGAAGDSAFGEVESAVEVVAFERFLRRELVPGDRTSAVVASFEVLRERGRVARALSLEPSAREAMAERPIGIREHDIRGLADDVVTKSVLGFVGICSTRPAGDELAADEDVQPFVDAHGIGATA